MTPEQVAASLARDTAFKGLSPDRQKAVYQAALQKQPQRQEQDPSLWENIKGGYENVVDRPSAAVRGGIQAMAPGGQTPLEGYFQGTHQPESVPKFQDIALDKYWQGVGTKQQEAPPTIPQHLMGYGVSAAGMGADILTNPAEMLATLTPFSPMGKAIGGTKPMQRLGGTLTKERKLGIPKFRKELETVDDLLAVPEKKLPKLTDKQRGDYFKFRTEKINRQYKVENKVLEQQKNILKGELNKAARDRSLEIRDKLPELYGNQSRHYRKINDVEIAPVANEPVPIPKLKEYLMNHYGKDPERLNAISGKLGFMNETPAEQAGIGLVDEFGRMIPGKPVEPTITYGKLYKRTLDMGQDLPRSVREGTRIYSPDDVLTDDAIHALVEFMADPVYNPHPVDLSVGRTFWRKWKPLQKQSMKEYKPFNAAGTDTQLASSRLKSLATGLDPDNQLYNEQLSKLLGIDDLPGPLKKYMSQLSAMDKQKVAMELQKESSQNVLANLAVKTTTAAEKIRKNGQGVKILIRILGTYVAYRALSGIASKIPGGGGGGGQ